MRPFVRRGGRPGDETYYLNIPRDVVRALGITKDDEFELSVKTEDGSITLCFKRKEKGKP